MDEEGLKTLKEIAIWIDDDVHSQIPLLHPAVDIQELKKEAIKWIKELERAEIKEESYCLNCREIRAVLERGHKGHQILNICDPQEPHGPHEAMIWIKHFFGISEEDLK